MTAKAVEPKAIEELAGQMVGYLTGAAVTAGVVLGDHLGLYAALDQAGQVQASELAIQQQYNERLVREWLDGQSAAGLVTYDPATDRYSLSPEAAMILADEESPAFMAGGAGSFQAIFDAVPKIVAAFKTDGALAWGDHHPVMYDSVARFFRPGYRANLTAEWLPALDGVVDKLTTGATIADVGCGFGHSSIVMAEAFPEASIVGFDFHAQSIERATELAAQANLGNRARFEIAAATKFAGSFDLICFFDCLHDMGDPVAVARHAREQLAAGGSVMLVEPFALGERADNIADNPAAAMFYHASTFLCTPCSLAQDGQRAMGGQSGPLLMSEVFDEAGYGSFDQVFASPFNAVYEATV